MLPFSSLTGVGIQETVGDVGEAATRKSLSGGSVGSAVTRREREREKERKRERHTDRQTDRQTYSHAGRQCCKELQAIAYD